MTNLINLTNQAGATAEEMSAFVSKMTDGQIEQTLDDYNLTVKNEIEKLEDSAELLKIAKFTKELYREKEFRFYSAKGTSKQIDGTLFDDAFFEDPFFDSEIALKYDVKLVVDGDEKYQERAYELDNSEMLELFNPQELIKYIDFVISVSEMDFADENQ